MDTALNPSTTESSDRTGLSTPEVATTRWCPWARPGGLAETEDGGMASTTPVSNRAAIRLLNGDLAVVATAGSECIAGACMAWRWADEARGYCALAGRPVDTTPAP